MMTKMVLSLSSSGVGVLLATKTEEANALQLAPLGKPTRIGNEKRTDASIEEIKEILREIYNRWRKTQMGRSEARISSPGT